jgi:competence protein ComEC
MSREQWRVFNATGTTHLVAISGLHVTLFAVVAFAVSRAAWSAFFYRFVRWPRENFAAVVGFVAAAGYATLAGLSVPTQRTLIMLGVWLFTRCVARATPPFLSLALALVAVLLFDPFAPLAPGFWLSFGAMGAIILVTSTRFARPPMVFEALAVQVTVTMALVPLTLAAFGSVSLVGPLVNVLAIPAMSWIFVPTILVAMALMPLMPTASDGVLGFAAWLHEAGWPWLAGAADMPWALVHATPPLWWYALAVLSMCVCLMPVPGTLRLAAFVWMLPLAASVGPSPTAGSAEVTILDVGEGTAIVVQTEQHAVVLGTGDVYGTGGRTAETVLIPFLRSRGVRQVDMLLVGRLSAASAPGITALLAELPVRETWVAGDLPPDLPGPRDCREAASWNWDGVHFEALSVDADTTGEACVLAIEAGAGRVLIPGDIDASVEQALASTAHLAAQLVVVPRHGSDTASSHDFVRAVGARWAVVSGRRERGGREKAALGRWREHGAAVLTTADLGAIRFRLDPATGLEGPVAARAARRTLWRSSP